MHEHTHTMYICIYAYMYMLIASMHLEVIFTGTAVSTNLKSLVHASPAVGLLLVGKPKAAHILQRRKGRDKEHSLSAGGTGLLASASGELIHCMYMHYSISTVSNRPFGVDSVCRQDICSVL